MSVFGIAGLPGSGKSRLLDELLLQGYSRYDDVNKDWKGNLPKIRAEIEQGRNVAVSDIMFCRKTWRERLERELGVAIQWIFFERNIRQCARNCLRRFFRERRHGSLLREMATILLLSIRYKPQGRVLPVANSGRGHASTHQGCGPT